VTSGKLTVVQLLGGVVLVDVDVAAVLGAGEVLRSGSALGSRQRNCRRSWRWTYITAVLNTPDYTSRIRGESDLVPQTITKDLAARLIVIAASRRLAHIKDLDDGTPSRLIRSGHVKVGIASDLE
jgi:hypothetical protein